MNKEALDRLFQDPVNFQSTLGADVVPAKASIDTPFRELSIDLLTDLEQPFRLYSAAELDALRQSVHSCGVIQRILVRPYEGGYQIISGRHRRTAARLAGYQTVPCEIRNLSDDDAVLQMIETNLQQRSRLLPSEKAWAYRLRLEAMNRQGRRTDLTLPHDAAKSRSDDEIGKEQGISGDTVQRHVRLTYLLPEFLACVDEERMGLTIGETLSFLSQENQAAVYRYFYQKNPTYISQTLAAEIRAAGEREHLTEPILAALADPPDGAPLRAVSLPAKPLRKYFKPGDSREYIVKTVEQALEAFFRPRP